MSYSKYGNRNVEYDGQKFDSEKELNRWLELRLLERAGEITGLERQVRFRLIEPGRGKYRMEKAVDYIADFVYADNRSGATVVEDCKGCRTDAYIIKRKLMLSIHGVSILET